MNGQRRDYGRPPTWWKRLLVTLIAVPIAGVVIGVVMERLLG